MSERTDEEEVTVDGSERADSDEQVDGSGAEETVERAGSEESGAEETVERAGSEESGAEETVERADADETTGEREDGETVERTEDRTAARFLELESELAEASGATLPDGTVRRGTVVDATLVPVSDVPEGYPVALGDGGRALALTVDLEGGREVPAYLDWPEEGSPGEESTLGRLLAGLDVAPGQLADLYGRRVLARVAGEHYSLYVPETAPRGDGSDVYGMLASAVGSLATLVGAALGLGSGGMFLLAFALVTFVALPLFTYRDAWYLRTHSDWEGGPLFWTTLAMLPGVNLLSTGLYLRARNRATFLRG